MLKKTDLERIVQNLVVTLGNHENLAGFAGIVADYQANLANADEITEEQAKELAKAQKFVEAKRKALVSSGIMSEIEFSSLKADENGGKLAKALATVQTLTGSSELRRQQVKLQYIPLILGESGLSLTVSAESASLGVKAASKGKKSANPDRKSLKELKIGLAHAVFYHYSKKWYEVLRTPEGWRVFDLNTREEVGNPEKPAETSSAAQKAITGGWADAFRGYNDALPAESGVNPLKPEEIA